MYNLLVANDSESWNGDPFILEVDRCIRQYTDKKITEKYGDLSPAQIKEIIRFPCIFAYESQCHKDPKFGLIHEIVKRQGLVKISYEIIHLDKFLIHSDLVEMRLELDIHHWEYNRTHWAIKDVNLPKELVAKGIKLPQWIKGHRIFVSHSHLDNDFGTKFAQDLRHALNEESAVWYDVLGGLHGGETWWEKIVEELTARDVFIVVLSPDAMNSNWVRREITIAINEGKYILPVLYRACSIRADLKIIQIISFLAPTPYERAFQEVLLALGLPIDTPVEPMEQASTPSDPTAALFGQLQAAFAAHDWPDVLRKADYLIKRIPGGASALVYRLQGLAMLEEGEEQRAQEALETALALASEQELRLTLLSDSTALLAKQGQWAKVQQLTREALRMVPNDPGWLATQQQAQSELVKQAPLLGAPSPRQNFAVVLYNQGNVLDDLKRFEEAIAAYDQAIGFDPNYADAYCDKGIALNNLKRHEEAIAAFDQAIRLNANYGRAYYNKRIALEKLGKRLEAQQANARARQLGYPS